MSEILEPGVIARRLMLRRVIGTGIMVVIGRRMAMSADAQVVIDNFTFSPTPLKVNAGTTVIWVNHDDIPHSIVCPALKVHSHALDTDDTFTYKFDQAGTYDYLCGIHPHMRGQVVVQG
jgi:plastocyanin